MLAKRSRDNYKYINEYKEVMDMDWYLNYRLSMY